MKRHLLFLFSLIISTTLLAQVPQGISHQAVMRDAENNLIVESPIGLQVSILQGAHDGDAVYVETHNVTTNTNGLITYIIGEGDAAEGQFAEIDWSAGPYFFKTEADPDGGTNYSISGVTQFLSVPYAHFSQKAASLTDGEHTGEILYWDGNQWLAIVPGETGQTLTMCDGVPTWGPCMFTLSLHANPADGGSVAGQGSYQEGTAVNISAEANTGWEFVNWTDAGGVQVSTLPGFVYDMPPVHITLTANFTMTDYTLTLAANPAEGGSITGAGTYHAGQQVNITATANEGWEFVNWTGDTQHLDDADLSEAVVTMPADDVSIIAVFQEEDDSDIIYGDGVTDIDGNFYPSVIIGNQEWMAENLRVTRYNNEDDIPSGLSNAAWSNTTSGAYAIYNNSNDMLDAYGKLYNWYAVDDSRGLCPAGWSVPSHDDWTQLEQYVCNALGNYFCETHFPYDNISKGFRGTNEGNALKSCRQVDSPLEGCNTSEHPRWNSNNTHYGFDEFGFSALPGGFRILLGSYFYIGFEGTWWSSSEYSSTDAWYRYMRSSAGSVHRQNTGKRLGLSVRCIRDISEEPTLHNLNLEVNPEGSGSVSGAGEYQEGSEVSITAIANEGWEFVNWTGDTQHLDDADLSEAVVTMPDENVTLTANFQEEGDSGIIYGDGVTDIDGNFYPSVIIGNQEWMAENLRVTRYNNENNILTGLSNVEWQTTTSGAYAIYNNDDDMLQAYGKLYNWYAVGDSRGLCPEGWSVPSHDDWTQLEQYICNALGNSDCETHFPYDNTTIGFRGTNESNALKSCRQVDSPLEDCNTSEHPRWNSNNTHYGFDEFGFSALPGGFRVFLGSYFYIGFDGTWWSSSEYSSTDAWYRYMRSSNGSVHRQNTGKRLGLSVRCIRDNMRTEAE